MPKSFARVSAVPKTQRTSLKVVETTSNQVINLNQVDLNDRENWLRALEICKSSDSVSLETILSEIQQYQGQIDQALRTAEAQSTIYAYAIGTRLDTIEARQLFINQGYENLTSFIKAGEVKRPNGESITTRQVWAYRSVTRGLNQFLSVAEAIRDGDELTTDVKDYLEQLGQQINQDIVESFLHSYTETITNVLELGVSKLEQVCRLPQPIAVSGLLTGKIQLQDNVVEMGNISFSELRKAISTHENNRKKTSSRKKVIDPDKIIASLNDTFDELQGVELNSAQIRKLKTLSKRINRIIEKE